MGDVKFEDFYNNAIDRCKTSEDPQGKAYAQLVEVIVSKSTKKWDCSDLVQMISVREMIKIWI